MERQEQIDAWVREEGQVALGELASRLGVSEMTVRRDLDAMTDAGLLVRVRGGAVSLDRLGQPGAPPALAAPPGQRPAGSAGAGPAAAGASAAAPAQGWARWSAPSTTARERDRAERGGPFGDPADGGGGPPPLPHDRSARRRVSAAEDAAALARAADALLDQLDQFDHDGGASGVDRVDHLYLGTGPGHLEVAVRLARRGGTAAAPRTVVVTGLDAASALSGCPGVQLVVLGGSPEAPGDELVGPVPLAALAALRLDHALLFPDAADDRGLWAGSHARAALAAAASAACRRTSALVVPGSGSGTVLAVRASEVDVVVEASTAGAGGVGEQAHAAVISAPREAQPSAAPARAPRVLRP